jgi:hypothetical protein
MSFKSKTHNIQPVVQLEATANWQHSIVEELNEAAGAAIVGGAKTTRKWWLADIWQDHFAY